MNPLFTTRIGACIQTAFVMMAPANGPAPGRNRINWPWGKLSLFQDHMQIGMMLGKFELPYSDIRSVERHLFFWVRIHHDCYDVPDYVSLFGLGLMGQLERAAQTHRLPLRVG